MIQEIFSFSISCHLSISKNVWLHMVCTLVHDYIYAAIDFSDLIEYNICIYYDSFYCQNAIYIFDFRQSIKQSRYKCWIILLTWQINLMNSKCYIKDIWRFERFRVLSIFYSWFPNYIEYKLQERRPFYEQAAIFYYIRSEDQNAALELANCLNHY